MKRKPNRLIREKSPYLRQHAYNPVDWYPWGEEAFEKAKKEDKPLFISIGYSTCHWCHVMEKESFEDPEIAEILNKYFVPIKVDREERPDVDSFYMDACIALTGHGGWPLTVFATPDKKPFYVGTYFPKESKWGKPGLKELLLTIAELWQKDRQRLLKSAEEITKAVSSRKQTTPLEKVKLDPSLLHRAFEELKAQFDPVFGGFGEAPKFPTPHKLLFLNRYYYRYGKKEALQMVELTLTRMRLGGIYDQIGCGFHRYSTDRYWLLPHFEKMLYDQAMLIFAYTEGYLLTNKELFKETVFEIFEYLKREMLSPEGGFYSAQDADSEGEEGKYYTWSVEELKRVLTPEEFEIVQRLYNIEERGNYLEEATRRYTGRNILYLEKELEDLAEELNLPTKELQKEVKRINEKLLKERLKRVKPLTDRKILTDWNGIIIAALSYAGRKLGNLQMVEVAKRAAEFVLKNLKTKEGKLYHRYAEGEVKYEAFLEDYAYLVWGLTELYEAVVSFENFQNFDATSLLKEIKDLTDYVLNHFWDPQNGGFFQTSDYFRDIPVRKKETYDGAIPSANSVMAYNLVRVGRLLTIPEWENFGERTLKGFAAQIYTHPSAYAFALIAFDLLVNGSKELYIVSKEGDSSYISLLREINRRFIPDLDYLKVNERLKEISQFFENLKGKEKTTYYLCSNYTCRPPVTDVEEVKKLLLG